MSKEEKIKEAIEQKKLIGFDYNGLYRFVEPHVLGELRGVKAILAYQTEGESSSGILPDWRRFNLNGINNLQVFDLTFSTRRSSFDHIEAVIKR